MDPIRGPLAGNGTPAQVPDSVATILDRETESTIKEWLARVSTDENLAGIELDGKTRSGHLPQLFQELVHRLRCPGPLGTKGQRSRSAREHGLTRHKQGYSAAMLVEESRLLQVSIFDTLRKHDKRLDLNVFLNDVMVIADEVDLQLAEAITSFIEDAKSDASVASEQ
jgi:hypothetical protein